MIRFICESDIDTINKLLQEFNYSISRQSFEDSFFNGICYIDDKVIGVLIFKEIYERIEIEYIVVDKIFRKKGIASKLMDFLIEYVENKKIENISLEVNKKNIKAINLYKKYNFKIAAIRKNYYYDSDGYLMIRR